jgi:hypothetical protein
MTKAFRRPPPKAVQQSVRDLVTGLVGSVGPAEALKSGLVRVLVSPYFHQHVELGQDAVDCASDCPPIASGSARLRLSQHEIAARLSYQLTSAPPDDALLAAAGAGKLTDVDALKAHAARLLSTPRVFGPDLPAAKLAQDNWRRIVIDWLGLQQVADPDAVVAKDLGVKSSTGLGAEAQEELLRFATAELFDKKAPLTAMFTDKAAFPYTDRLALAFGVARSDAVQPIGNGLEGVVLRPATLLSGRNVSSPILRGAFINKRIMCRQIPDPDPNAVDARLQNTTKTLTHKDLSNRDYYAMLTSPPACNGCHAQIINPVGYTLEGFGPTGAPRTVEAVYDLGGPLGISHPLDTAVDDLRLDPGDKRPVPSRGAADTIDYIAKSARAADCFDAWLIVNTHYRPLDASDRCLMDELGRLKAAGQPAFEALVGSVVNEGIFWKSARGLQ